MSAWSYLDIDLHRSGIYSVGGVRMWIEAVGQTQPFVHVEGDPHSLPPEEMRAAGAVMHYLAELIEKGGGEQ